MIASIAGQVAAVNRDHVVIAVNGLGYQVFVPDPLDFYNKSDVFLHTQMIVREDSLTLYGFRTLEERDIFGVLIKVSGIGPRLAIAILSAITIDSLRHAVQTERAEILTRVPGIGKKTAQKIVFELKDKLVGSLDAMPVIATDDINTEVMDALVALGYSIVEAQTAIQSLPKDAPESIEERVRLALQQF
jgi:holliday junction DNA helicase RuvA